MKDQLISSLLEEDKQKMERLPDSFIGDFREKLEYIKEMEQKIQPPFPELGTKNRNRSDKSTKLALISIIAAMFIIVIGSGPLLRFVNMGSGNDSSGVNFYNKGNETAPAEESENFSSGDGTDSDSISELKGVQELKTADNSIQRKLVRNYELTLKLKEFDEAQIKLYDFVDFLGGYIELSSVDTYSDAENGPLKRGSYTIRIPQADSTGAYNKIRALGEVEHESSWIDDITDTYRDIEGDMANLIAARDRYKELYKKAEDIKDMLEIETELTSITNRIDRLKSRLINYDNQVDYATIKLEIREYREIKKEIEVEEGVFTKAKNGIIGTINNIISASQSLFIFIVSIVPYLLILPVIAVVVIIIRKKRSKK